MIFTNRDMRRHPDKYGITLYAPDGDGAGAAVMDRPANATAGEAGDGSDAGAGGDDKAAKGRQNPPPRNARTAQAKPAPDAAAAAAKADADKPDATKAKGAAPDAADAGGKAAEGDKGDVAKETPKLSAEVQALVDAARAEGEEIGRTAKADEVKTESQKTVEAQRTEKIKGLRESRDTKLNGLTVNLKNSEGEVKAYPLEMFPELNTALKAALGDYDTDAEEHFGIGFRTQLDTDFLETLPKGAREAAQTALDQAEDYKTYGETFGEAYAPHAQVIKAMGLDDIVKLSPTARRELSERIVAEKEESRLQGQDDPKDEKRVDGSAGGSAPTKDEFLAMSSAQQRAAYKQWPAEIDALK